MDILNKLGGAIAAIASAGVGMDQAVIIIALPVRDAVILCYLIEREIRSTQPDDGRTFKLVPAQEITWRGAKIRIEVKP